MKKWEKVKMTEAEIAACQRVADVFEDLYEMHGDMTVAKAGDFGFVHLTWFDGSEFGGNRIYTDSEELFNELWQYYIEFRLLQPVKGTHLVELSYEELYNLQTEEGKKAFADDRMKRWQYVFGDKPMTSKGAYAE